MGFPSVVDCAPNCSTPRRETNIFTSSTLQVFYSQGNEPLKSVTNPVYNNNAGEGQYQVGILKKPTGTNDVVNSGYQSPNLDEGLIYGSLFVEDSANDCVSL